MDRLAIVIPAYKGVFFNRTLQSIASQTCKDFTLYIGDDCSPDNLKDITLSYFDKIKIAYKRFDSNLGRTDLVSHWERCIDMVSDEEWIWLFSDDDLMDADCVEKIYQTLAVKKDYDLLHFNVAQIDENDRIIKTLSSYPPVLSSEVFYDSRMRGELYSFVVEYIFRKSHFLNSGRFVNFDLAWGSDDATWIKLSEGKGILTIPDAMVYWRHSQYNISPNYNDLPVLLRKFAAQVEYSKWLIAHLEQKLNSVQKSCLKNNLRGLFFLTIKARITFMPYNLISPILNIFYKGIYQNKSPFVWVMYFKWHKSYRILKTLLLNMLILINLKKAE